jgi:glycosyltransferase involved in cell wall biosynthesis
MQKTLNNIISVVIACRNGSAYLAEAVTSVKAQCVDFEVIVVDDGSTDNTHDVAASLGCKIFSISHRGLSAARNVGMQAAQGGYILFLDHDDVMTPGSLRQLFAAIANDADFVSAKVQDFVSPELSQEDKDMLAPRRESYGGLLTGAYLFKRSVFAKVGGFDETLQTGQGVEFLLRCTGAGLREQKIDFVAARRRLHNANMGRTMRKQENKDYSSLLRKKIRRAGGRGNSMAD